MDIVTVARNIAIKAHQGQTRWGGEPYITHPEAVAKAVAHLGPVFEAVAWLHDVLEDTETTLDDLKQSGLPWENVIIPASLLSRRGPESYLTFILRCRRHPVARVVKEADIRHNLETSEGSDRNRGIRDKWLLALYILTGDRE